MANKRLLFSLHKWAALALAVPFVVMAITGIFMAVDHHRPKPTPANPAQTQTLSELMLRVQGENPGLPLMRGLGRGPGGNTAHLLLKKDGPTLLWAESLSGPLHEERLGTNFWYLNKQLHESFLLSQLVKLHSLDFLGPLALPMNGVMGLSFLFFIISGILMWVRKQRKKNARAAVV